VALLLRFPSLCKSFLPEFLSAFCPVSPLALVSRAIIAAKSLTAAFSIEEVPALRVRAGREVAGVDKLPPKLGRTATA
jgi:hypothetical protein